jgi:hypothetical protein
MARWRRLLVAVLIAWCCVAADTPARGAPSIEPIPPGRGLLDPGQVSAMLEGTSSTGWQPNSRTLYRVVFVDLTQLWLVGLCADPPNPPGSTARSLYRWDGAAWILVDQRCVPPLPAPVPLPGAVAQAVRGDAPIAPALSIAPSTRGLVGLPVVLSYTGPRRVPITTALAPFTVTATATVKRMRWLDGTTVLGDRAGVAATTSARTVFRTGGRHAVTVEVTWSGTYVVLDGRGVPVYFGTMADVVNAATVSYPVIAVEAVIS